MQRHGYSMPLPVVYGDEEYQYVIVKVPVKQDVPNALWYTKWLQKRLAQSKKKSKAVFKTK